jgi:hypothetical protein
VGAAYCSITLSLDASGEAPKIELSACSEGCPAAVSHAPFSPEKCQDVLAPREQPAIFVMSMPGAVSQTLLCVRIGIAEGILSFICQRPVAEITDSSRAASRVVAALVSKLLLFNLYGSDSPPLAA